MTQSDKGLTKIAEGASPRRHAETSPLKVKGGLIYLSMIVIDFKVKMWLSIAYLILWVQVILVSESTQLVVKYS